MNPTKFNIILNFLTKLEDFEEEFQCKYCTEVFTDKECLLKHSVTVHIDKRYVCNVCYKEYTSSYAIIYHMQRIHKMNISNTTKTINTTEVDDDYNPAECDEDSDSEDSVYDEYDDAGRQITKKEKFSLLRPYPRKCDHCDYEVPKRTVHYHHYLFMHSDIIDQYPFPSEKIQCPVCGILKPKSHIRDHELTHYGKKEKCTECDKIFGNIELMKKHRQIVHTTKRYICDHCSKPFKTRSDITIHLRLHSGERPYKCHICGAGFAHGGNRLVHIRSAHQNVRPVPKNKPPAKKQDQKNMKKKKGTKGKKKKDSEEEEENKKNKHDKKQKQRNAKSKRGRSRRSHPDTDSDNEALVVIKKKKYNKK